MRATCATLLIVALMVAGRPFPSQLLEREVPQEHSHEKYLTITRTFLQKENPKNIVDPVFGLLGDKAAAGGLGDVTNVSCLQQETADQAFTNAKAENDVDGMVGALMFRALERNTPGVGVKSKKCPDKAVNPEIAAIQQHQDPASKGAAKQNKAITLELAKQIDAVGGDSKIALEAGTFKAGDLKDFSGKGNTCDDQNDKEGCIFANNSLVNDATKAEIKAAVAGSGGDSTSSNGGDTSSADGSNTGDSNTGDSNTGDSNSGDSNTGDSNSGDSNSGDSNSGDSNSGDSYSGAGSTDDENLPDCDNKGSGDDSTASTAGGTDSNSGSDTTSGSTDANSGGDTTSGSTDANSGGDTTSGSTDANSGGDTTSGSTDAYSGGDTTSDSTDANGGDTTSGSTDANSGGDTSSSDSSADASGSINPKKLGKCSNPKIQFGTGFEKRDVRTEASFEPADKSGYRHGSAQNIGIITQFMCDTLLNNCKVEKDGATDKACRTLAASVGEGKDDGALADKWNAGFGIKTNFASKPLVGETGADGGDTSNTGGDTSNTGGDTSNTGGDTSNTGGDTANSGGDTSNTGGDTNTGTGDATGSQDGAAGGDKTGKAGSGGNLQTFNEALGGVTAPEVTVGGRGFLVKGNADFQNEQNALGRSCDVQHNKCADAANASGNKGDLTVEACGKQQDRCNALAKN